MAFEDLNDKELLEVAEFFAVDVPEDLPDSDAGRKKILLAALAAGDEPVTWDDYENVYLVGKPQSYEDMAKVAAEREVAEASLVRDVLLKMHPPRAQFRLGSVIFTETHPFATVTAKEADYITRNYEGFSYATPREAADYYA